MPRSVSFASGNTRASYAACNMLSAIYNRFTEGFETKDLQEVKALLRELG